MKMKKLCCPFCVKIKGDKKKQFSIIVKKMKVFINIIDD
jgi:hypothetical protein